MPEKGLLIEIIDNLTLIALLLTAAILLFIKGWKDKLQSTILVHVLYNISLFALLYVVPMESDEYKLATNLTIHIDTISGMLYFYWLWEDTKYRKFLIGTMVPVILTWLVTLIIKGPYMSTFWTNILPSVWFVLAAGYAMLLLYRSSGTPGGKLYASRFLLVAGFLFYNFIFLVLQSFYIQFKDLSDIADAWNINYWSYFIFRLLMLSGVLFWVKQPISLKRYARSS